MQEFLSVLFDECLDQQQLCHNNSKGDELSQFYLQLVYAASK